MTKKQVDSIADSLDQDPEYKSEPYFDEFDQELTEEQLFRKYTPRIFPKKIALELMQIYPKFKTKHRSKLKKMVGSSAFFYGPPGTGKTYLACLLVLLSRRNSWFYLDLSTKFYKVADLMDDLRRLLFKKDEFDPENGMTLYDSLIDKLKRCKYLVLDDLGIEKTTEYAAEILDRIIDSRYSNNRVTIVTTNYKPDVLLQLPGYGRMVSRLMDMVQGQPVLLTKVYRKIKIKSIKF